MYKEKCFIFWKKSKKIILWLLLPTLLIYAFNAKTINQHLYKIYFIYVKKNKLKGWFNRGVSTNYTQENLHHASRWTYLNTDQFKEIVLDGISKMDPSIEKNSKVFELGVGVGAALKVIENHFGSGQLELGGSDIAEDTIDVAKKVFPTQAEHFFACDMVEKHTNIPDNYYDYVVSFGALGMYLTKDEMLKAIKEAVRMTKPGGSLLFTHFIAPEGETVGSIVDKVEKTFFEKHAKELGIENIKIYDMKHQGDRYQVVCKKSFPRN